MPHHLALALTLALVAQTAPDSSVRRALDDPKMRVAFAELARAHDQLIEDTVVFTEIPAPPFQEHARAMAFKAALERAGLTNVEQDAQGNILGLRRGSDGRAPVVVIAAHLDTVFPEGTDVRVRREGTRLSAPGVGDNARSLAVLVAMARALDAASIQTRADVLFVGNVGEEGAGNLSGVRYLFTKGEYRSRIGAFIALDGTGPGSGIVDTGIGIRRYRVRFTGPGGHSYGAFGTVNPAFALAAGIQRLSRIVVSDSPRTTFNVGVIGGGTSVNAIPADVWMDVDLRSESTAGLERLERQFTAAMRDAAAEENRLRSTRLGRVSVHLELTGSRPSGRTPANSTLVASAEAVIRAAGMTPTHSAGSTDANIPMSLGIPAIAMESGGNGDRVHTLEEWIDVETNASLAGVRNALALLVVMAGTP